MVARAVRAALAAAQVDGWLYPDRPIEVSVAVTGDDEIQQLNREYRGVDRPTDVLSFALQEGDTQILPGDALMPLGEVIVSLPSAARQARELEHSLDLEMSWLIVHGTLQLIGYGHATTPEAEHMEKVETAALRALGFRREPR